MHYRKMIAALAAPTQAHNGLHAALAETSAALWALAEREPSLPFVRCELLFPQRRLSRYSRTHTAMSLSRWAAAVWSGVGATQIVDHGTITI